MTANDSVERDEQSTLPISACLDPAWDVSSMIVFCNELVKCLVHSFYQNQETPQCIFLNRHSLFWMTEAGEEFTVCADLETDSAELCSLFRSQQIPT